MSDEMATPSRNALPDDPRWCGHAMVCRSCWACAACDQPVTPATRARLEGASLAAPAGHLWVVEEAEQDGTLDPERNRFVLGLFTNLRRAPALLVRAGYLSRESVRARQTRVRWLQGAYNHDVHEVWEIEPREREDAEEGDAEPALKVWTALLEEIDNPF